MNIDFTAEVTPDERRIVVNIYDLDQGADALALIHGVVTDLTPVVRRDPAEATISLESDNDEHVSVVLDGEEVIEANHDEHGWKGMDLIVTAAKKIADATGATFVDNR